MDIKDIMGREDTFHTAPILLTACLLKAITMGIYNEYMKCHCANQDCYIVYF